MSNPMQLVDSHCHLDYTPLVDDRAAVVTRAREAGVVRMLNIATTRKDFPHVRATAELFEDVYCSVGVHPHHVAEDGETVTTEDLIVLAAHEKVVGVGETGLDYHYDRAPRDLQEESFRRHLRACVALGLPVIVHSREAEEDTARLLREESAGGKLTGVMHCFTSRHKLAEDALALGFYISLSGILTFKNAGELRDTARLIPLDRLLIETDSPYLAPLPYRGKPCEPAYIVSTAQVLAELRGLSLEDIARQTTANFFALFKKVKPVTPPSEPGQL
ncbi:MAG: TatD family hydrolase [Pseudomonadota bacterium]|nr:TatD family hydrolase [Pseudomonadota bacterium]